MCEGAVAPQQQSVAVEHGYGIGDRVKGLFPFALATTDEVVEARILDGHADLPRNDRKQALIGHLEPSRDLRADGHRAQQLVAREDGHRERAERGHRVDPACGQQRAQVIDEQRRTRADHAVVRAQPELLQPRPHLLHRARTNERLVDKGAGDFILQID